MNKTRLINFRITEEEKELLQDKSDELHFKSVSEYIRFVVLNTNTKVEINKNDNDKITN